MPGGGLPTRTLRLALAYDGTAYHGWQVQAAGPTIQGALLEAARRLDAAARLTGASRTDAGVHALGQVASLRLRTRLEAAAVQRALNAMIPADVRVLDAAEAPADFDARRGATGKRYAYLLDTGPVAHPLWRRYAWHVPGPLDLAAMRLALGAVRGCHDFSAFCAAPGRGAMPTCTIRSARVLELVRRDRVMIALSADRFLHHMVRNVVSTAVMVGQGRHPPAWLGEVLAGGDRRRAAPTAPAHGLVLVRVLYPR